jgi:antitoxin (DNA-binding transcriptional repressor) of toxin-antitoxin stability system
MNRYGIRQAKAHLSELARDATKGVCTVITDNRKPVAMIVPPPSDSDGPENLASADGDGPQGPSSSVAAEPSSSSAAAFRKAFLGAPFPVGLDF